MEEELEAEVKRLEGEVDKLNKECQKYRIALNRVARPSTWGIPEGYHAEIARRALVIGEEVDPLPEGAKVQKEQD